MPCRQYGNAIICSPNIRKFRFRNKYYYVENPGWSHGISDSEGSILDPEDFDNKTKRKFYKEMTKSIK